MLLIASLLTACATTVQQAALVPLGQPAVEFPSGRIMLQLVDENGMAMTRTKVDFHWEEPNFYRTSGFTNNMGQITFTGVPEVAEVSIDHPGGNYSRVLLVPQRGIAEMRVILDTYGANQISIDRMRLIPASQ